MIKLKSSAIVAVDYDPDSRDLLIWFTSGGPYTFHGVPEDVFVGLLRAPYSVRIITLASGGVTAEP